MGLSYVPFFGLFLLAGVVDFASARVQISAVPFDTPLSGTTSSVAIEAEAKIPIEGRLFPPLQAQPNRWMVEAPATATGSDGKQVAPEKRNPATRDAPRSWLGVRIQEVTQDIADGLGMKVPAGALVAYVIPGSPASRSDLRRGDVILKIDGQDVGRAQSFVQRIARTPPGKAVSLVLYRRGTQQTLTVKLDSHPAAAVPSAQELPARSDDIGLNPLLGVSVELLSDEARSGHGIAEHVIGVVITQVQPTQKLLKVHDVVVEVDQVAVKTPDQLVRRVNAVRRTGRRSVLLTVAVPHGETRYVAVSFSTTAPGAKQEGKGDPLKELPPLERLEKLK